MRSQIVYIHIVANVGIGFWNKLVICIVIITCSWMSMRKILLLFLDGKLTSLCIYLQ
jgi:hypothetical protein